MSAIASVPSAMTTRPWTWRFISSTSRERRRGVAALHMKAPAGLRGEAQRVGEGVRDLEPAIVALGRAHLAIDRQTEIRALLAPGQPQHRPRPADVALARRLLGEGMAQHRSGVRQAGRRDRQLAADRMTGTGHALVVAPEGDEGRRVQIAAEALERSCNAQGGLVREQRGVDREGLGRFPPRLGGSRGFRRRCAAPHRGHDA
ncbi:hypothetical protein ABE438_18025 [Bosea sp. TWI1241]|uniref:hypothetical protein n=1 Tax=Bosea sp. TWI1241 TaxID=3148904 RepID=UPI003209D3E4